MIEWREQRTVSGLPVALPRPLGRHRGSQVTPTPLLLLLLLLPGHVTPVLTGSSTALHHPSPYHDTTNHHSAATTYPVFDPLQNKTLCCWDPGAARALATDNRRPAGTYGPTKRQQSNPLSHAEQPPK
uniref:Uncharacterized protein n=1 Tax=Tetradesmus obliquus TaxID=3088 RepID=A0A383WKY3_TETOB|eukprot:jgi/Sobl393_1/19078/SZX77819.1